MARPQAVDAAKRRRYPDRAAGIGAQREVHVTRRHHRGRARRRAAGNAARRVGVDRRAVVKILADHAVGEFLGDGLARHGRAGVEQHLHHRRVVSGRLVGFEPFGVAAAGDAASDVDDVLHRKGQTRQRAVCRALDAQIGVAAKAGNLFAE